MSSHSKKYQETWDGSTAQDPKYSVLIIDSDDLSLRKNRTSLRNSGFSDVEVHTRIESAQNAMATRFCDLVFLEIPAEDEERGFRFLTWLRRRGFRGVAVVFSSAPTVPALYRAAMLGASEFLVKNPEMNFAEETIRLLGDRPKNDPAVWQSDAFLYSGLFNCMGLTKGELEVLRAFAVGFPRHQEIAERLGKNSAYIRKTFSRIYEKISYFLPVENPAQLSNLITVCSLFR